MLFAPGDGKPNNSNSGGQTNTSPTTTPDNPAPNTETNPAEENATPTVTAPTTDAAASPAAEFDAFEGGPARPDAPTTTPDAQTIRDNVLRNIAESKRARESSNFGKKPKTPEEIAREKEAAAKAADPLGYYMDKANSVDVNVPPDKSVFYSGTSPSGVKNGAAAEAFTKEGGGHMRIEDTPGGRWLNDEKLYDQLTREQADQVWTRMSERFASQATGEVHTFVEGALPERVFYQTEYPILQESIRTGRVTRVTPH